MLAAGKATCRSPRGASGCIGGISDNPTPPSFTPWDPQSSPDDCFGISGRTNVVRRDFDRNAARSDELDFGWMISPSATTTI